MELSIAILLIVPLSIIAMMVTTLPAILGHLKDMKEEQMYHNRNLREILQEIRDEIRNLSNH